MFKKYVAGPTHHMGMTGYYLLSWIFDRPADARSMLHLGRGGKVAPSIITIDLVAFA